MSEIFSPGSVAGPQGPSGAAGSLANVKSLTDTLLPNLGQLYDHTRALPNTIVNADGSIGASSGFSTTPMMYCAGATYAITNLPLRMNSGSNIALYDANGNFMSVISFTDVIRGAVFSLPGTQTYLRGSLSNANLGGGYNWPASVTDGEFFAGTSSSISIPSPHVPFGIDTVASVNAKDAAVAATAQSNLVAALSAVPALVMNAVLPGPHGSNRNLFDSTAGVPSQQVNVDGTVAAGSWTVQTIYCPGATSAITNIPIRVDNPYANYICTYDAQGNFLEEITSAWSSISTPHQNYIAPSVTLALRGNQTYVKFGWAPGSQFNGSGWATSPTAAYFYAGNSTNPLPAITALNRSTPFLGYRSPVVKTATELGCDTTMDVAAILNNFLATASSSNPVELILDGMFSTGGGLVISANGYTTIRGIGLGSGITLVNSSPQDGIRIGPYVASTGYTEGVYNITLPARTATNIILRDFTINSTAQRNALANEPVSGAIAHAVYGAIFASATNILVDNVNFLQSANYALALTNVGFVKVTNCKFISTGTGHDGVHIDGPSEDIGIINCDFTTGDDAIALNAPEGYGGDISRVTVANCRFNSSLTVMRVYPSIDTTAMPTNNAHRIRNVVVTNCSGMVRSMCFDIGITNGVSSANDVEQLVDFSVSNCSFSATQGLAVLLAPIGSLNFSNIVFAPLSTAAVINGYPALVDRLCIDGLVIRRNSEANFAPSGIVQMGAGTLGTVVLRNISVVDTPGTSYAAIGTLVGTGVPIGVLDLGDGIDMTHITALVDSGYSNVTKLRGNGVLGSGASVPDATMDNGWLYASSSNGGAVSLKVAGTAKRLTLT